MKKRKGSSERRMSEARGTVKLEPVNIPPSDPVGPPAQAENRWLGVGLFLSAGAFALLLITAARGDLWFDELWSLSAALGAPDAWSIFGMRHDNNHLLNTLWLRMCGDQHDFRIYRGLSILCGALALPLISWIAFRKWGTRAAILALWFFGLSYPIVLLASEARGYAGAVLCGLAVYGLLQSCGGRLTVGRVALFPLITAAGLGFHGTFAFMIPALGIANVVSSSRGGCFGPKRLSQSAQLFALPLLVTAVWYFSFWRLIEIGGGPKAHLLDVVGEAASFALGLPVSPVWGLVSLGIVIVLCGFGAWLFRGSPEADDVFFPLLIIAIPAGILLIQQPEYLHFRYFIVCVPFLYLLIAGLVECGWKAGPVWLRVVIGIALLGTASLQVARIANLVDVHRGTYRAALADIWQASGNGTITVASDYDQNSDIMVAFYSPAPRPDKKLQYVRGNENLVRDTDWFLFQTQDNRQVMEPRILAPSGSTYLLYRDYPFEGVSGWRWILYRRVSEKNQHVTKM